MSRGGATSYYSADGLGSITSMEDGTGSAVAAYTYDAFGNITNSAGSITNPFRYTGREWDSETSLYYYRARYYDPSTGRFLSEDSTGFEGGVNFFAYVGNNPTNITDSDGHAFKSCAKAIADLAAATAKLAARMAAIHYWKGENIEVHMRPLAQEIVRTEEALEQVKKFCECDIDRGSGSAAAVLTAVAAAERWLNEAKPLIEEFVREVAPAF
jgi:RHS repeat-associated protein